MSRLGVACLCALIPLVVGAPRRDEVTRLPGLNRRVPFKHYSGYLAAAPDRHLHYWSALCILLTFL